MKIELLKIAIILAGVGQILTAIIYPFVRYRVLHWFDDLKNLSPLNHAIAKTYGYYIQGINFSFGLLSVFLVKDLLVTNNLTTALAGFLAIYWIGRISFQLKDYSFRELKNQKNYRAGIWSMNLLITFFAISYMALFVNHLLNILA